MKQIVDEQAVWVEEFVENVVRRASVDCRRDLLWQRLLVGGKVDVKQKNKKEDLIARETVSYSELDMPKLYARIHATL